MDLGPMNVVLKWIYLYVGSGPGCGILSFNFGFISYMGSPQAFFALLWVHFQRNSVLWVNSNNYGFP